MPKYDNGKDWVEIKGVAQLSMRELSDGIDAETVAEAHRFAVGVTADAHFVDRNGSVVDWKSDPLGLTVKQWNWWKSQIWRAARDEELDPQ